MPRIVRTILTLIFFVFAPALWAEPLDLNTATVEQLDATLVGVGGVKAQAIVNDREKNGRFASVDDLLRVKGIGPATLEKNRGKLSVGAGTPPPAPAGTAKEPAAPTLGAAAKPK